MQLVVHGPNLFNSKATFHVHTLDCRDNSKEAKQNGSVHPHTMDAPSVQEIAETFYADQMNEQEPGSPYATWGAYVSEFHFAPCIKGLPQSTQTNPEGTHPMPSKSTKTKTSKPAARRDAATLDLTAAKLNRTTQAWAKANADQVKWTVKVRSSGTRVGLVDNRAHSFDASDHKWFTICLDHGAVCGFPNVNVASEWRSHPTDWCPECAKGTETPTPAKAPAKPRAKSAKAKAAEISGAIAEDAYTDPTLGPVELIADPTVAQ